MTESESDEEFVAAVCDHGSDADEVVVAADVPGGSARDAPRQRGRRWQFPSEGTFFAWFLVDAEETGPVSLQSNPVDDALTSWLINPDHVGCVGVARLNWCLRSPSAEVVEKHEVVSGPVGARAARALGFLQYDVEDIFPLEDAVIFQKSMKKDIVGTLSEALSAFALGAHGCVSGGMSEQERKTSITVPASVYSAMMLGTWWP
jgi:hypothetical protein